MKTRSLVLSVTGVVVLLIVGACATARHTEPIAPELRFSDATLQRGERVFAQQCHMCHPHGQGGLGPAIVNKPLPAFLMKFQVRHGLGTMPSFKPDKIPPEDLDALIAYIKAVRANKPLPENITPQKK